MTKTIVEIVEAFKGKGCDIECVRPIRHRELSAGNKHRDIRKESLHNVFVGRSYDNHKTVQEARENGDLPAENQGMPGKEWIVFPILKRGKGDNLLLSVYPAASGSFSRIIERIDGMDIELDNAQYRAATIDSIHDRPKSPQPTFDLTVESIRSITIGGVKWCKAEGVEFDDGMPTPATFRETPETETETP